MSNYTTITETNWNSSNRTTYGFFDCMNETEMVTTKFDRIRHQTTMTVVISLTCFGLLGNALSIIVIMRYLLRSSGTFILFLFVSLADTLVLFVQLLEIVTDYFGSTPTPRSDWQCKLAKFFWYFSFQLSSGMIMALTVDRYITVRYFYMPQARHQVLRRALLTGLGIVILTFFINSPFFFITSTQEQPGMCRSLYYCTLQLANVSERTLLMVINKVHLVVSGLVPYSITLLFNSILLYQIRNCPHTNHKRTTLVLLIVTFSFIILTLPNFVHMSAVQDGFVLMGPMVSSESYEVMMVLQDICRILQVFNNSINVVFFLFGRQFRQSLVLLFKCARDRRHHPRGSLQYSARRSHYLTQSSLVPPENLQPLTVAHGHSTHNGDKIPMESNDATELGQYQNGTKDLDQEEEDFKSPPPLFREDSN